MKKRTYKFSEKSRLNMSKAHRGKNLSKEHAQAISDGKLKGNPKRVVLSTQVKPVTLELLRSNSKRLNQSQGKTIDGLIEKNYGQSKNK